MKKAHLITIMILILNKGYSQIENRWLPDSIYAANNVKTVYVYLNSPKDLSEDVELDKNGKIIRRTKYSASYNRKTRKSKYIQDIVNYKYEEGHLKESNNQSNKLRTIYRYSIAGKLISAQVIRNGYNSYCSSYQYNPFSKTTTLTKDSIIIFNVTKTYDKDYYVNRSFGFALNPTLKKDTSHFEGELQVIQYSDYDDMIKYKQEKTIDNEFNLRGQLVQSTIHSKFMNDRINEYTLTYKYYRNGLLKSIRGYVPRHFKYDYYE